MIIVVISFLLVPPLVLIVSTESVAACALCVYENDNVMRSESEGESKSQGLAAMLVEFS